MLYKKSQTGWLVIGIFAPIIIFLYLAYANQWGNNPIPLIPFLIMLVFFVLIASLFYRLTIKFDGSILKLIYGIGLIRISFKIDRLEQAQIIKTPWYYGLGIRMTPEGMLYNIQGPKAVKIRYLSNGRNKSVMIGTLEPEKLNKVLETHFKK